MDILQAINLLFSLFYSETVLRLYFKNRCIYLNTIIQTNNIDVDIGSIKKKIAEINELFYVFVIDGFLLLIGFYLLFSIQTTFSSYPIFVSGIHVPFFLLLIGTLFRIIYNNHTHTLYMNPLSAGTLEKVTILVSVIINLALIFVNAQFALFVLSIILGKYIWIDFAIHCPSYSEWKDSVNALMCNIKSSEIWSFGTYFGATFLLVFIFLSVFPKCIIENNDSSSERILVHFVLYIAFSASIILVKSKLIKATQKAIFAAKREKANQLSSNTKM